MRGKVFLLMTEVPGRPDRDPQVGPRRGPGLARGRRGDHSRVPHEQEALDHVGGRTHDRQEAGQGARDRVLPSRRHQLPKSQQPVDPDTYGRRA